MLRSSPLFILAIILCSNQLFSQSQQMDYLSPGDIKVHVKFFTDPALRGRNTPSSELDSSASYIASCFKELNLHSSTPHSFHQPFYLIRTRLDKNNTLNFNNNKNAYRLKKDFIPHPLSGSGYVKSHVIFVGYGITAPEYNYDDYENIDVNGAIVWILTQEPQQQDSSSIFAGIKKTKYAKLQYKLNNAKKHGAVGAIILSNPLNSNFRRPPNIWPSLMRKPNFKALSYRLASELKGSIPAIHIGNRTAEKLTNDKQIDLLKLQALIDSTLIPQSRILPSLQAEFNINFLKDSAIVNNVVAYIEGIDPVLKHEAIIIGAHYDHLGAQNDSTFYLGADDNASGTAGVLALAAAFAAQPVPPARSLIFSAWAGEEKGLLGSKYFVETPLWPLTKIACYINMDMIGRLDSSKVYISGTQTSAGWDTLVPNIFSQHDLCFVDDPKVSRSDHVPFYKKRIAVLDVSTGFHPQYHTVDDTIDRIDWDGMSRVCKSLYMLIRQIANNPNKIIFIEDPDSPLDH
ncbi:M28 family peptidase [bacterium]|nr:M28 family peptidase [bacterium]